MSKIREIVDTLEFHKALGIDEVIAKEPQNKLQKKELDFISPSLTLPKKVTPQSKISLKSKNELDKAARETAKSAKTLQDLKECLELFEGCSLKHTAMNTVFADGVPSSKVMVIGEAPGADEDRLGKPFVGLSGQLLDKMLASIGLSRQKNIYISNILPWRPPGNRQPTAGETSACLPFIERHIELIRPKIILLVGGTAGKTLLNSTEGIMKLRGHFLDYETQNEGFKALAFPTFHPAYLLRSPGQKKYAWQDLLRLKHKLKELAIEI